LLTIPLDSIIGSNPCLITQCNSSSDDLVTRDEMTLRQWITSPKEEGLIINNFN
jgi:hypothetical protein